jgi:hypothetical protein
MYQSVGPSTAASWGQLMMVGGPRGAGPTLVSGTVIVTDRNGNVIAVQRVGDDKTFSIRVPAGDYVLAATTRVGLAEQEQRFGRPQAVSVSGATLVPT